MNKRTYTACDWLLFPMRLVGEILVTLFDMVFSRYLIAFVIVGFFWLPLHLIFETKVAYLFWPTLVFGTCLCGLWDACNIFGIRRYVGWVALIKTE